MYRGVPHRVAMRPLVQRSAVAIPKSPSFTVRRRSVRKTFWGGEVAVDDLEGVHVLQREAHLHEVVHRLRLRQRGPAGLVPVEEALEGAGVGVLHH